MLQICVIIIQKSHKVEPSERFNGYHRASIFNNCE